MIEEMYRGIVLFYRFLSIFSFGILSIFVADVASAQENFMVPGSKCVVGEICGEGLICYISDTRKKEGVCRVVCDLLRPYCPRGEKCVSAPFSGGVGACVCKSDSDCMNGDKCVGGVCGGRKKTGDLCQKNSECPANHLCISPQRGLPKRCYPLCTSSCEGGIPCKKFVIPQRPDIGICLCSKNSDCEGRFPASGGICVDGLCYRRAKWGERCNRVLRCQSEFVCYVPPGQKEGICTAPCLKDSDCISGEKCVSVDHGKVCVCDSKNPCRAGFLCKNYVCRGVELCSDRIRCSDPNYLCLKKSGSPLGGCVKACMKDSECPTGTKCRRLLFGSGGACYCTADNHCAPGYKCVSFRCLKRCTSSAQCPGKTSCKGGLCIGPPILPKEPIDAGEPVPDDEPPPIPDRRDPNACSPPCPAGQRCVNKRCVVIKKELGEACDTDSQCRDGLFCFDGGKLKICTTDKCSQCPSFMPCRTVNGRKVCFFPPPPPGQSTPEQPAANCQCGSATPPLFLLFFLALALLSLRRRPSPPPPSDP